MSDIGEFTSWRQVGRSTGGALKRPPKSNNKRRSNASIPTKFEVTLKDYQPKKAFGSTGSRFSSTNNELPGPGTYAGQSSLETTKPSVGKKGMGNGFVSKSRRGAMERRSFGPGPGSYDVSRTTGIGYSVSKQKTGGGGSAFGRDTGAQRDNLRKVDPEKVVPGPGAYRTETLDFRPKLSGPSPAFRQSKTKSLKPKDTGLGPGAYNVVDTQGGGRFNMQSDRKKGSAVFRSRSSRDPFANQGRKRQGAHRAVLDPLFDSLEGEPPGPGHYAVDSNTIGRKKYNEKPSQPHPYTSIRHVEARQKAVEVTPGPGDYNSALGPKSLGYRGGAGGKSVSSSMFLSGTERSSLANKTSAPGPAFYKPQGNTRKSFLLNQTGKWTS